MAEMTDFEKFKEKRQPIDDLVSIVIPTLNNLPYLTQCLEALEQTCDGLQYEIIVVCNEAKPETCQYLQGKGIAHIALDTNRGFGTACNLGADKAKGKYICFLNDDTLPAPNWLHNLLRAIKYMQKDLNLDAPVAAVGPVSNAVAGDQCLRGKKSNYMPWNRSQVAQSLKPNIGLTHFLSGFCLFVDKERFEEVGKFDERFFAGAEDNAIACAFMKKGYLLGVVGNSYVFHFANKTISRPEFKKLAFGVGALHSYHEWYSNRNENQKLAVIYRVKVQNGYIKGIFERSLHKSAEIADIICVLDDGTEKPIGLTSMLDGLVDTFRKQDTKLVHRRYERAFEERRDRNELLEMAQKEGADWILALDCDEILEDKATYAYMHRLMATPIPHHFAYTFGEYTFWNDENHWRFDAPWGQMNALRMWRVQAGRHIRHGADSTSHCEHIPLQPPGAVGATSIRIKHYGYVKSQERARKFQWYERIDTDKRREMIGFDDYQHLVDESDLKMRVWIEDCSIAVTTMMRNEINNLPQWISQAFPFADEMVICDTGSDDGSIEFAKWCGATIIEHPWADDFSTPRNKALEAVKSTWVLQLDMDELLGGWGNLRRMLDYPKAHGYMFYVRNILKNGGASTSETIRLFRPAFGLRYVGTIHETIDDTMKEKKGEVFRSVEDIVHLGYLIHPDALKGKMMYYLGLCEKEMKEHPERAKPYYNTAVHYMEMPQLDNMSERLLQRCLQENPTFYQARKELGMLYLRKAIAQFKACEKVLPEDHGDQGPVKDMLRHLAPFGVYKPAVPAHVQEYFVKTGRINPDGSPRLQQKIEQADPEPVTAGSGSDKRADS